MEFLIFVKYYLFPSSRMQIKVLCIMSEAFYSNIPAHYSCDRQKFPHSLPKNILWSFLFLLNNTSSTFPESKLKFRKLCRKRAMTIFMFPSHHTSELQKFPHFLPNTIF